LAHAFLAQEEVIYPTLDDEWEPEDDLKPRQHEIDYEVKKKAREALKSATKRKSGVPLKTATKRKR